VKAAEDELARQRSDEQQADKNANDAIVAEQQSEKNRMQASRDAAVARQTEKSAAETRIAAAEAANVAAEKHKLSSIVEDKAFVAKDKIAMAARLAAHTLAEKAQADKEELQAKQTALNADVMAKQAKDMMQLAQEEKDKWAQISSEATVAKAQAKEAMQGSRDAQGVVDRMNQQVKAASQNNARILAEKAKEMQAKSLVAQHAAQDAADHACPSGRTQTTASAPQKENASALPNSTASALQSDSPPCGAPAAVAVCTTRLAEAAALGATAIVVESSAGCRHGSLLVINRLDALKKDFVSVQSIEGNVIMMTAPLRQAHEAKAPVEETQVCKSVLFQAADVGATKIVVADAEGCGAGDYLLIDATTSSNDEIVPVKSVEANEITLASPLQKSHQAKAPVEETQVCKTLLTKAAGVGANSIEVADASGCKAGEFLLINGDGGDGSEIDGPIKSIDLNVIFLTVPLKKNHAVKDPVEEAQMCRTVLTKPAALGAMSIEVEEAVGCKCGDFLLIGGYSRGISSLLGDAAVTTTTNKPLEKGELNGPIKTVAGNVIFLSLPLRMNHAQDASVEKTQVCQSVLAKTAIVGASEIELSDATGCKAGAFLRINGGAGPTEEIVSAKSDASGNVIALTSPLRKPHFAQATVEETQVCKSVLAKAAAAGATSLDVEDAAGCKAGDFLLINGHASDNSTAGSMKEMNGPIEAVVGNTIKLGLPLKKQHGIGAPVEEMQLCKTVLAKRTTIGFKQIEVVDTVGCKAGAFLLINGLAGEASEINGPVQSVDANVITLTSPLEKQHEVEASVEEIQVCKTVLVKPAALGANSIEVDDAGGCKAGGVLIINKNHVNKTEINGPIKEVTANVITLSSPLKKNHQIKAEVEETKICRTVLATSAAIGADSIEVEDTKGCMAGNFLLLSGNDADKSEVNGPITEIDGNVISLTVPLKKRHEGESPVEETQYRPDSGNCVKLPAGNAGCPAGSNVATKEECEQCHDELNLHRGDPWEGATAALPGACSWRGNQHEDFHWNQASVGEARDDMSPVCRKMHTSAPTAEPTASPTVAPPEAAPTGSGECKSVLSKAAAVGDKQIEVVDVSGCKVGDLMLIDGLNESHMEIATAYILTGYHVIILATPLTKPHADQASVARTTTTDTTTTTADVQQANTTTTTTTVEPVCIALPVGSAAGCPAGQEIETHDECRLCSDELGLHRVEEWVGSNGWIPSGCSWRDQGSDDLNWNSAAVGAARSDMVTICRKVASPAKVHVPASGSVPVQSASAVAAAASKAAAAWEQQEGGTTCRDGTDIQTLQECEQAHDALGLHRNKTFVGSIPTIPSHCAWRDRDWDDLHWNTASTGRPRADLHPICRKKEVASPPQAQSQVVQGSAGQPAASFHAATQETNQGPGVTGAMGSALGKISHFFR
jgi:hypothetical protein